MSDINNPTKLPSIPSLEGINDPATRTILEAIKEILEVREGTRPKGQGLDRSVTYRDLFDAGIVNLVDNGNIIENTSPNNSTIAPNSGTGSSGSSGSSVVTPTTPVIDLTPPASPTGFIVTGAMFNILLEWNEIATGYMEIFRANTNDIGIAVSIGKSTGFVYPDFINESNVTKYYWIRQVSSAGIAGDYNSFAGTPGTTAGDSSYFLSLLNNQLTTNQLTNALNSRINLIDNSGAVNTTVDARIGAAVATETTARSNADTAIANTVTTLSSTIGDNTTAIATEQTTRASQTGALFAQYTVKIDSNGYVSGFGLASTLNNATPYSEFVIVADKFSIAPVASNPNSADGSPFYYLTSPTVVNGVTIPSGAYMKAAYIADATITNAKIANLAVDTAKIVDLAVSDAKIQSLSVSKLIAGTISASESVTVGSGPNRVIVDGVGNIRMGATGFGTGDGLFFGSYGGYATFYAGSASGEYVSYNGINLNINTAQFQIINGNATFSGALFAASGTFAGDLQAAGGTFSGNLLAANGTFYGDITGSTGEFAGSLRAGVIDISSFGGRTDIYTRANVPSGQTVITVPAQMTRMRLTLIGGGGGGGATVYSYHNPQVGNGGANSTEQKQTFTVTPGSTFMLYIGAAGLSGGYQYGAPGTSGGNTAVYNRNTTTGAIGSALLTSAGGAYAGANNANYSYIHHYQTNPLNNTTTPIYYYHFYYISAPDGPTVRAGSGEFSKYGAGGVMNYFAYPTQPTGYGAGGAGSQSLSTSGNPDYYYPGTNGGEGRAIVEFYNPNSVVLQANYDALKVTLGNQGLNVTDTAAP
jgi:hypothetical protein